MRKEKKMHLHVHVRNFFFHSVGTHYGLLIAAGKQILVNLISGKIKTHKRLKQ